VIMEIYPIGPDAPRVDGAAHPRLLVHQLATLRAMLDTERRCDALPAGGEDTVATRMGILGDKPGSGKSYVVADLMLNCPDDHIPRSAPIRLSVSSHMSVTTMVLDAHARLRLGVLVVPHNIVGQWSRVLEEFGAGDRAFVVSRVSDLGGAIEVLDGVRDETSPVRLMLVTAMLYPDVVSALRAAQCSVSRVVFDEADSLRFRNPNDSRTTAGFYWFVTASVENMFAWGNERGHSLVIRHSDGDVSTPVVGRWSQCKSASVRALFTFDASYWSRFARQIVVVADNAFVDSSFGLLPPETHDVECAPPLHARVLQGIASRGVLDRLNAGDLEAALMHLHPERTDSEPNIVSAALAHLRLELSNATAVLEFVQRRRYASDAQAEAAVTRQRGKVARLQENIDNVTERIRGATECLICYSHMTNKTVVPCCSNSFCLSCITTWVTASHPSCPMCKRLLRTSDFLVCCDVESERPSDVYEAGGATFDRLRPKNHNLGRLLRMLGNVQGTKILFFCDNDYALENAGKSEMVSSGIPFASLKGNAASIAKRVREFNDATGPRALLVNCSHYGCGMNLNRASDVILYHSVDPRMEQQIVGRAQRSPRTSRLRVWRFANTAGGRV
jgi:hypothetical protein